MRRRASGASRKVGVRKKLPLAAGRLAHPLAGVLLAVPVGGQGPRRGQAKPREDLGRAIGALVVVAENLDRDALAREGRPYARLDVRLLVAGRDADAHERVGRGAVRGDAVAPHVHEPEDEGLQRDHRADREGDGHGSPFPPAAVPRRVASIEFPRPVSRSQRS